MIIQGLFSNSMIFPCMELFCDFPGFPELVNQGHIMWMKNSVEPDQLADVVLQCFQKWVDNSENFMQTGCILG